MIEKIVQFFRSCPEWLGFNWFHQDTRAVGEPELERDSKRMYAQILVALHVVAGMVILIMWLLG